MRRMLGVAVVLATVLMGPTRAGAAPASRRVAYEIDKKKFEGVLLFDDAAKPGPGLVLVPNWLGINDANTQHAAAVAARGYVVFVADMYGVDARPKTLDEAGKLSAALKNDRGLMRKRMKRALEVFTAQKNVPLDVTKIAATGFCFGGTSALELARSGASLAAVVTFHAGLASPTPADARQIKARVLALHGADDPFVPADEVKAFEEEMRSAKLDWQLVAFGNAVHSFTDVDANMPGKAQYNATVSARAYAMMDAFLAEAFARAP